MPPRTAAVPAEQIVDQALSRVSSAGDDVEDVLRNAERDIADVFKRRHNELRPVLDDLAAAKAAVVEAVAAHPQLFVKPRSRLTAGVRASVRKGADKWEFDPEVTAGLIREHQPKLASAISTQVVIDRKKLAGLTPAQLKKLGIVRTPGTETTTVKRLRDDLDERMERLAPWLG